MDRINELNRLNLGCGRNHKKGYVNADILEKYTPDIVLDMEKIPWKLESNFFDEVYLSHVLEHVKDPNKVMGEIHRVLKKDGKAVIIVPHFTSIWAFRDPTHRSFYTYKTFEYFLKDYKNLHYFDFGFAKIKSRRLVFPKKIQIWNYLLEFIFNLCPSVYECSFLRVFPAHELRVELVK